MSDKLPEDSAAKVIEDAVESGEVDVAKPVPLPFTGPEPEAKTILLNANDANFVANELREVRGEVELGKVVDKAMERKDAVAAERARRKQHDRRLVTRLRQSDPPGKKTCGRCAYRVDINKMCPKQELCDICYE